MRALAALILVFLAATGLQAAPVAVTSGEHAEFTRIVLQFEGPTDWQFGRTLDGYALRVPQQRPDYDLGRAFDLIGRSRLGALAPDPATGDLRLGITCACYAMPFEFRPGIVVIDLYDGAPPEGSSFEAPLPVLAATEIPPVPPPQPQPATAELRPDGQTVVSGYDWTALALNELGLSEDLAPPTSPDLTEAAPPDLEPNLDPLRQDLIEEMARGATAGLIDLVPQEKSPEAQGHEAPSDTVPSGTAPAHEAEGHSAPPQETQHGADPAAEHGSAKAETSHDAQGQPTKPPMVTHLGESPELDLRSGESGSPTLTAKGAKCLSDEALDIAAWGSDRAISDQLGPIRQGMEGEFDKPEPDAIARVIRFYLYIGFGAEARSVIRSFPDTFAEAALWTDMAHILDGEAPPNGIFAGMEDCDTAAALWAILANPGSLPRDEIGRAAISRSFSALPASIRRQLGPRLAEPFLASGDIPAATSIYDAVMRAPGDLSPEIRLLQVAMAQAKGRHSEAEARLEPLAAAPGPASTEALVELVEQRAGRGQAISSEQVMILEAALAERAGSEEEARYRNALVLAQAAAGDFDAAFAGVELPETQAVIWRLLAQSGGDSALLTHATLPDDQPLPEPAREPAAIIADRMLMLGLAPQAARWLRHAPLAADLLRAKVALANGDAQAAINLLSLDRSPAALQVTAEALQALGDETGAAKVFEELGKAEQQYSALSRAESWNDLSSAGPQPWQDLARIVTDAPQPADPAELPADQMPPGPLEKNKALVDESVATRDAITTLLDSVEVPAIPSQ